MSDAFTDLVRYLDFMTEEHRKLLKLAEYQRQALINGDSTRLQDLITQIEDAAKTVTDTELQRIAATEALAEELGLNGPEVTVSDFVAALDVESGERLTCSSERLKLAARELSEANERNAMLTRFSIQYTETIFTMVAGAQRNESYGPGQKPGGGHVLNLKA